MRIWINRWAVGFGGQARYFFTPTKCEFLEAQAIAASTFGAVDWLSDEGDIRVTLTDAQIDGIKDHSPDAPNVTFVLGTLEGAPR